MDALLAIFSPRKQPSVEPPKPLAHSRSKTTYSRKDRDRAKRAMERVAVASDSAARSPRTRTSNASSITAAHDESGDLSRHRVTLSDMSSPVATTAKAARPPSVASRGGIIKAKKRQREASIELDTPRPQQIPRIHSAGATLASVNEPPAHEDVDMSDASPEAQLEDDQDQVYDVEQEAGEAQYSFKSIDNHRWVGDAIELHINWNGSAPSWEPEMTFHEDASDALFAYWRSKGGRPENPNNPGLYDVFAIRRHYRGKLLVEWVGYEKKESSWVARKVIEETAKPLVDDYFATLEKTKKKKVAKK
ncbi:hypothetical protein FZEAL_165 [Fusarium zealandicum]|uniref:Chromo domain-containing protein n=1 Tax=Fusarium zealandicum TaxID=1053134 RepID=A0A8H4XQ26_9HYPO|nr:hypothetical protein FZEAL_165 [Fusarium zealandicum]